MTSWGLISLYRCHSMLYSLLNSCGDWEQVLGLPKWKWKWFWRVQNDRLLYSSKQQFTQPCVPVSRSWWLTGGADVCRTSRLLYRNLDVLPMSFPVLSFKIIPCKDGGIRYDVIKDMPHLIEIAIVFMFLFVFVKCGTNKPSRVSVSQIYVLYSCNYDNKIILTWLEGMEPVSLAMWFVVSSGRHKQQDQAFLTDAH